MVACMNRCTAHPTQAGLAIGLARAWADGYTGSSCPPTHCTTRSEPSGEPLASQLRLPSTVGQVPLCRAAIMVALSTLPYCLATSSSNWPHAYASAAAGSMAAAVPPYFATYAFSKAALPAVLACGNQSPVLKVPSALSGPTFAGKVGSFGPPVKNRNLGVQ